jgi:hypothetical protein
MEPDQNDPNRDYRQSRRQDEKQDEKDREKKQEKGGGLDEKYRRDPLNFVSWAVLIIWLGVTLLLQNMDVAPFDKSDQGWAIFTWGGGAIIFAEALLRLLVPRWRRSIVGSFIWGAIWVGVGFGLWYDKWEVIGPVVIIAIGVALLAGRLFPRR